MQPVAKFDGQVSDVVLAREEFSSIKGQMVKLNPSFDYIIIVSVVITDMLIASAIGVLAELRMNFTPIINPVRKYHRS